MLCRLSRTRSRPSLWPQWRWPSPPTGPPTWTRSLPGMPYSGNGSRRHFAPTPVPTGTGMHDGGALQKRRVRDRFLAGQQHLAERRSHAKHLVVMSVGEIALDRRRKRVQLLPEVHVRAVVLELFIRLPIPDVARVTVR